MTLRSKVRALLVLPALLALSAIEPATSATARALHAQETSISEQPAIEAGQEQLRDTAQLPIEGQQPESATVQETGFMAATDRAMGRVNAVIGAVFFFDVLFFDPDHTLPLVVIWLVIAAIFLTFRMGFINIRAFKHALNVTAGKYTDPQQLGEVSHFQALTAALSATVGLGNIAGVAIAVSIGGPGATFWMILAGLLGMTSKFTECTLGQQYREVRPDGRIMGGAMFYLSKGLAAKGMPKFGKVLAVMFAILCIGGSLGGGNSFQVNQSLNAVQEQVPFLADSPWIYGLIMAVLVGIVIIGGIRRIATVTEKLVPFMVAVYVAAAIYILLKNFGAIPGAFGTIFSQAFAPDAAYGGSIGTLVVGFQRAAFSNEAGAGSAAIAHSAAKTDYPVREGIVSLLEPFIDTVVVCTMTALVIVITGAYNNPEYADLITNSKGAALTSRAMGEELTWFPYVLSASVIMFAYSTMISWSYYGERCWAWMF
ncbi:MAG TPA: amino acid carrier protein, partial [Gemmatimonadaceae bacterium]|nr:amino acid carrier protein [Gemmatimonadaceae bacterium]